MSPVSAFELVQVTGVQSKFARASTKARLPYSLLNNKKDIANIIAPKNITGYIGFNRQVGILTFSVLSPKKAKMYLKWDNVGSLYPRANNEIKFRRAGEYKSISFNVTKPSSGYIYLYNSSKKLLRKIHYVVKKQRRFSQSIKANSTDKSIALNYYLSQRVDIGAPRWSVGVNISSPLKQDGSKKSVGASIGYTW